MNKQTLIKQYIKNKLSPKQKKEFEEQMQSDLELKQAVNDYWLIDKILSTAHQIELLEELENIATLELSEDTLAAKENQLATQFFTPFKSDMLTQEMLARSVQEQASNDSFTKAIYHYNNAEYDKAIACFLKVKAKANYYASSLLYLGNAYIAAKKPIMAVTVFEQLLDIKAALIFKEVIEWYLALALLVATEQSKAKALLNDIAANSTDRYYRKKATKLLSQLANK